MKMKFLSMILGFALGQDTAHDPEAMAYLLYLSKYGWFTWIQHFNLNTKSSCLEFFDKDGQNKLVLARASLMTKNDETVKTKFQINILDITTTQMIVILTFIAGIWVRFLMCN